MRSRTTTSAKSRWPFWLLIAAWVCANSPQVAIVAVLAWLTEARTFSHQRELTREVAHLLSGEEAKSRVAERLGRMWTRNATEDETPQRAPLAPPVVLKRIDLADEAQVAVATPVVQGNFGHAVESWAALTRRAAPPHGPPRWRA
jgi:hypothetical protein